MFRWGRLKYMDILWSGVTIIGAVILIISLPARIRAIAFGVFLIWFGLSALDIFR